MLAHQLWRALDDMGIAVDVCQGQLAQAHIALPRVQTFVGVG